MSQLPAHGDYMRPSRDWSSNAPGADAAGAVEVPDADPRPLASEQYVACCVCLQRNLEPSVHSVYTLLDGTSLCAAHARELGPEDG